MTEYLSDELIANYAQMTPSGAHQRYMQAMAREVIELRKDRERLDWLCADENLALTDWIWDEAAKLCPLDWEEAEDTQKWVRAAIDAAMKQNK